MTQLDATRFASYQWAAGNTPTDPPQSQPFEFRLWGHNMPITQEKILQVLEGVLQPASALTAKDVVNGIASIGLAPGLEFKLVCKLWRWTPMSAAGEPGEAVKIFTCDTTGTRLFTGSPAYGFGFTDERTRKPYTAIPSESLVGPYIESINVKMGFARDSPAILKAQAPETQTQVGNVSSSISYGFNMGFFGTQAMGGISANYSNSQSMQLTSYLIRSDSNEFMTDHTMSLAMLYGGEPYTGWKNVSAYPKLPEQATGNRTMPMQGLWELPGTLTDDLDFTVTVSVTFQALANPKQYALSEEKDYSFSGENWGMRSAVPNVAPDPPLTRNFEKTLTWTRKIKVPFAIADKELENPVLIPGPPGGVAGQ